MHDGGGEQVDVDIADAAAHELLLLDKEQHFIFGGGGQSREGLQQTQHFRAVAEIAASHFADYEIVGADEVLLQQGGQRRTAAAQVVDPDRGVDQDHR